MLGDNDDCDGDPETRMIIIIIRRKSEVIRVHSSDMLQLTFHGVFFLFLRKNGKSSIY